MKKFLIVAIILFLFTYTWISSRSFYYHLTPEENSRIFFLDLISSSSVMKLDYNESDNQKYSTDLIKPRSTVISPSTDKVATSDFLGFFIFLTPAYVFLKSIGVGFVFSLFSLIGVFSVYKIVENLSDNRTAIIASILVALFPVYFFWSGRLMADIPSLSLILFGLAIYIQEVRNQKFSVNASILVGLLISIGVSMRYSNILFVILFILFFYPYKQFFKKNILTFHFVMLLVCILCLIPILILNFKLYGNITTTGQSVYSGSATSIRAVNVNVIDHINKFFISFSGVVTILWLMSLINVFRRKSGALLNRFNLFTLAIFVVYLYIFSRSDVFGRLQPDALLYFSHVRYYIPIYIIMLISGVLFLSKTIKSFHLTVVAIAVIFTFDAFTYKDSGYISHKNDIKITEEFRANIMINTDKDGYVFTRIYDRLIFPERKVVSYYNAGLDSEEVNIEKTINLLKNLKRDNKRAYFIKENISSTIEDERNYISFEEYEKEMDKNSMMLIHLDSSIYEVVRK